jgi:hypothetical protein
MTNNFSFSIIYFLLQLLLLLILVKVKIDNQAATLCYFIDSKLAEFLIIGHLLSDHSWVQKIFASFYFILLALLVFFSNIAHNVYLLFVSKSINYGVMNITAKTTAVKATMVNQTQLVKVGMLSNN